MSVKPPLFQFDCAGGRVLGLYEPGERPTVLLLHGNSADQTVFTSQTAMLRRHGFGVLVLDLPGHGLSDDAVSAAETYSFPGYAAAIGQVLDLLAISDVHVAGWSLGGHIGLELMGGDARVRSLLIWGTPPIQPGPAALPEAFVLSSSMALAGQEVLSDEECRLYARAMLGIEAVPESLVAAVRRTDGAARSWMVRNGLAGIGRDTRDLVARDPRPLAVLHGSEDPFVNFGYLKRLPYRNLWRNEVQVLAGVGHAGHLQASEAFDALLLAFLLSSS